MSEQDIEASKAPLMDHLIELRARLIKALLAFFVTFVLCFIFAKNIYNVLVWPFVWVAGPENSKFIYTALLEYFITQLKLAMFGAAFLSFPVIAAQIYMFVAPGLYRHERKAFLPYLIATPIFFAMGAMVVYFLVFPMLIRFSLHMQQPGDAKDAAITLMPKVGEYLSLMMALVLAFGVAFQLPVILTLARPHRADHLGAAQGQAPLRHCRRLRARRRPHAARYSEPDVARDPAAGALRGLDLVGAHRGAQGASRGRRGQRGRQHRRRRLRRRGAQSGGVINAARPRGSGDPALKAICEDWMPACAGMSG